MYNTHVCMRAFQPLNCCESLILLEDLRHSALATLECLSPHLSLVNKRSFVYATQTTNTYPNLPSVSTTTTITAHALRAKYLQQT